MSVLSSSPVMFDSQSNTDAEDVAAGGGGGRGRLCQEVILVASRVFPQEKAALLWTCRTCWWTSDGLLHVRAEEGSCVGSK